MKIVLITLITIGALAGIRFRESATNTTSYTAIAVRQDALNASIERGFEVYTDNCIQCHLANGEGVAETFPPLAKSDWLLPSKLDEAIRVIKYGQKGIIEVNGSTYNGVMANLGLYDDEVADVLNYLLNNWQNASDKMITEGQVTAIKE